MQLGHSRMSMTSAMVRCVWFTSGEVAQVAVVGHPVLAAILAGVTAVGTRDVGRASGAGGVRLPFPVDGRRARRAEGRRWSR